MKISRMSLIMVIAFILTSGAWANVGQPLLADNGEVLQAKAIDLVSEAEIIKEVSEKQQHAIQLINMVGAFANRSTSESDKENADYAYSGFIARFQTIRLERESLEKKEKQSDAKTLANCSLRFDRLLEDIQTFLK